MAKRGKGSTARRTKAARTAGTRAGSRRSVKRPTRKAQPKPRARIRKAATPAKPAKPAKRTARPRPAAVKPAARRAAPAATTKPLAPPRRRPAGTRAKAPRLDRQRRTLDETVPTPPSSLDMDRHASAARTGHAEIAEALKDHRGMSSSITGGDVDVDVENAYFTGDEAPGGDNPTPDQEVVDDIGKALGVQYGDNEELKSTDKITERDRHRWEMDPASSEDYKERK
jgi:uncharacterized protein DUF6335